MIDLHCHVLPGIDDGPRTIEESIVLARVAAANGIRTIVATPHASARYPNRPAAIRELVAQLNQRLRTDEIPIEVCAGAEIAMTHAPDIDASELVQMTLGGGPWLLLEPPFSPVVTGLDRAVATARGDGYRIVLAHPERCQAFRRDPSILRELVNDGALTSITAGSLAGRFGKEVRKFALRLADDGLVHNVASDAHDHLRRPPSILRELERAGMGPLAEWLTQAVPAAILAGEEIPTRPADAAPPHKRLRRWLRPAW
ncbi:MAG TPA: CpsB/CapC family capsule biosynthesis tyrosine phosphatase [Solirubrobacteraceae bacterium]